MSIDLDAIKARRAAYETAFEAKTQGREWCDPVAMAAIDCTDDVPALVAEVERLQHDNAQLLRDLDNQIVGDLAARRTLCAQSDEYKRRLDALSSLVALSEPSGGSV